MSKLTYNDVILFQNLLKDVFPDVECQDIQYPDLVCAVEKVIKEMRL